MSDLRSSTDVGRVMQDIIQQYESYGDPSRSGDIMHAYEYAHACHTGVNRKSGEPYIVHPVLSAHEVMRLSPDATTIIATLLHDTITHGTGSYDVIRDTF